MVGYTDNVGDPDFNQTLSERRAGQVVNHLQQRCGCLIGRDYPAPIVDERAAVVRDDQPGRCACSQSR